MVASHMVWGYVLGSLTSQAIRTKPKVALMLLMGALPDLDLYSREPYGSVLGHHGISHSWLFIALAFAMPLGWNWRAALPLFAATIQHPLFGDLLVNEVPLFFPFSPQEVGLNLYRNSATASLILEGAGLFLILAIRGLRDPLSELKQPRAANVLLLPLLPLLLYGEKLSLQYLSTEMVTYAAYGLVANTFAIALVAVATLSIAKRWLGHALASPRLRPALSHRWLGGASRRVVGRDRTWSRSREGAAAIGP